MVMGITVLIEAAHGPAQMKAVGNTLDLSMVGTGKGTVASVATLRAARSGK